MIVRRELPDDAAAVHAVHTAAFGRDSERDVAEARQVDAPPRDGERDVAEARQVDPPPRDGERDVAEAPPADPPRRHGERDVAEARLVDALRRDGDLLPALCLVATVDGAVVGQVTCSRATIGRLPSIGLGPLGVLPAHQGRGVGLALLHAVLGAADALDTPEVVLLGEPAYYRRVGFEPAAPLGVAPPDPSWTEHLQLRRLSTWTATRRGPFRYAPAFERL